MAALSALVEGQSLPRIAPLARTVDGVRLVMPTAWAPKPVGPPLPKQIGLALWLGSELLLKLQEGHRRIPPLRLHFHHQNTTGSSTTA